MSLWHLSLKFYQKYLYRGRVTVRYTKCILFILLIKITNVQLSKLFSEIIEKKLFLILSTYKYYTPNISNFVMI